MTDVRADKSPSRTTQWRNRTRYAVASRIDAELELLAGAFENAGPDKNWKGREIAHVIRERVKHRKVIL